VTGPSSSFPELAPNSSAVVASGSPELVEVIVGLRPVRPGTKLWGPAFTVKGRAGDNLALHRALAGAERGDVLVAELVGDIQRGHWGELMSIAAEVSGLAGLIIDGSIRDSEAVAARGFPTFHRGTHPLPAAKEFSGQLQVPVVIQGVEVRPGDGVCADDDGIVVVPRRHLRVAVASAASVSTREQAIASDLAAGQSTMRALGLDRRRRGCQTS
jgi:4-hydroxy-4-methyl-2-oxoglutarate aldolase